MESVSDYAIFMLDPDGRVVSWNEGAQRIKGYTPDEIIGQHFSVFYPTEEAAAGVHERELAEAMANGRAEAEGWRLRKDGSRFWATVVITALFDDAGVHRGFAKVTRDITDRKLAQDDRRRLDELRLRQRQALEVNDDIIQGLAVADLALNLEDYDKPARSSPRRCKRPAASSPTSSGRPETPSRSLPATCAGASARPAAEAEA